MIAIAVVQRRGQFLVARRPPGKPLAGFYEFPGGRIEANESVTDAARRECREETGLAVETVGEYESCTQEYEHGTVNLRFFDCRPCAPEGTPREPFHWVDRRALAQLPFPEGNRGLIARLMQVEEG